MQRLLNFLDEISHDLKETRNSRHEGAINVYIYNSHMNYSQFLISILVLVGKKTPMMRIKLFRKWCVLYRVSHDPSKHTYLVQDILMYIVTWFTQKFLKFYAESQLDDTEEVCYTI